LNLGCPGCAKKPSANLLNFLADSVRLLAGCPDEEGFQDGPGVFLSFACFFPPRCAAFSALHSTGVMLRGSMLLKHPRPLALCWSLSLLVSLTLLPTLLSNPAETARFNQPRGMAMDVDGSLLIADTWNHSIRHVAPSGVVSTIAGNGEAGYSDASGNAARFNGQLFLYVLFVLVNVDIA